MIGKSIIEWKNAEVIIEQNGNYLTVLLFASNVCIGKAVVEIEAKKPWHRCPDCFEELIFVPEKCFYENAEYKCKNNHIWVWHRKTKTDEEPIKNAAPDPNVTHEFIDTGEDVFFKMGGRAKAREEGTSGSDHDKVLYGSREDEKTMSDELTLEHLGVPTIEGNRALLRRLNKVQVRIIEGLADLGQRLTKLEKMKNDE